MHDLVTKGGLTSGAARLSADATTRLPHSALCERHAVYPMRLERVTRQWDGAVRTAAQRRWSVAPPVATLLARSRRTARLEDRDAMSPPTAMPVDEVVSEVAPGAWSIRTEYTLAQALRALGSCRAPFTQASQIVDELFSVATHPRYTVEQRVLLRRAAMIIDQLAALASQVFLMQSVCNLFRIVADILDGNPLSGSDAMDVNTLGRYVISLKRADTPRPVLGRGLSTRQGKPGSADIGGAIGARHPGGKTSADLSKGQGIGGKGASDGVAEAAAEGDTQPDETDALMVPGPARTTLEMHYGGVDDPLADAPPEAHAYLPSRVPEDRAMPSAEDAAIRDIVAGVAPARVQWTRVQTVPIRRNARMKTHWEPFALSDYRVADIDVRDRAQGEVFVVDGQRYLRLEGYALAVREFQSGALWIVDHRLATDGTSLPGDRYPPLPLRRNGNRWEREQPSVKHATPGAPAVAGQDGFFRYLNRKFVALGEDRVEVSRAVIDGEHALAGLAHAIHEPMPGGNAMQIIQLADGSHWIEGGLGYYRLRFDLAVHEFYVTDADANARQPASRVLVDFDIQRRKWGVLEIREGGAAVDGLALDDPMPLAAASVAVDAPASRDAHVPEAGLGHASIDEALALFHEAVNGADRAHADAFDDLGVAADDGFSPEADLGPSQGRQHENPGSMVGLPAFDSDKTGLDREFALFAHYARNLKHFAFFFTAQPAPLVLQRRALRHRLTAAFNGLEATAMVAVNRMPPSIRQKLTPAVLSLRRRVLGLYPPERLWREMTVQEKQYEVGLMIRQAYRQTRSEMWPCLQGYCNEIADLLLHALTTGNAKLRRNLLQIALRDEDGIRGSHVMVAYADEPAAFEVLADLSERDLRAQRTAPTLDEATFCEWLLQNRDNVLLIDAWSTHKIVDLTAAKSVADVRGELLPNLMEAGFDVYGSPRFTVRALLPERPVRTLPSLPPSFIA
ncbi:hypothetical protein [Robbsia sp. KACC 23696]|uniref:hypothetical protein n=1 Tax=Robbsia sp. KACC 23696 TaxID=3149231 RepID=UPI00325AD300